jgi:purine-binding chemotaxis protein CheW
VIEGIGRRNGEFVTVLDLDRLLGSTPLPATRAA